MSLEQAMDSTLSDAREKEIFRQLINDQKNIGPFDEADRAEFAQRYGISLETLKWIERKGMAQDWPPLD